MARTIQMTEGALWSNILRFSVPLVCSNVLQVLFHMSDIAVVGRFAGPEALGAVGSCAILVSLFTGLMLGLGGGVNALAARYMGAGDNSRVGKTVHSALIITLIYGAVVLGLGEGLTGFALRTLGTKEELFPGALLYLRVYLLGAPAVALYNYGNGVLSAAGDSRRPLGYLFAAGVLNVALNLFFVIVLKLAVLGVALASILSQYLSAGLILRRLFRCGESYALRVGELRPDPELSGTLLRLSLPAALQNSVFALANLFVQSAVNSFDTVMVEGNSAAANADALAYDVMAAFYTAGATFIAQNYGAGSRERVRRSYRLGLLFAFGAACFISAALLLFGRQFLGLFTQDEAVIAAGMKRLNIMACSYPFSALMDMSLAACRGLGVTVGPTAVVILGSCVFRVAWIYTVFAWFHTIPALYLLYICSWALTGACEYVCFLRTYHGRCAWLQSAGSG